MESTGGSSGTATGGEEALVPLKAVGERSPSSSAAVNGEEEAAPATEEEVREVERSLAAVVTAPVLAEEAGEIKHSGIPVAGHSAGPAVPEVAVT